MLESEENDIHDNVGLSDVEEDVGPAEPATELGTSSELQPESELVSPITEGGGAVEASHGCSDKRTRRTNTYAQG